MKPAFLLHLTAGLSLLSLFPGRSAFAATEPDLALGMTLRTIWGLLVVVGILFVIYGIMKKKMPFLNIQSKGIIKVVEVRHLMPKRSLYLVEVRGQEFLLGGSHDRIELIAPIGPATTETFAQILENSHSTGGQ